MTNETSTEPRLTKRDQVFNLIAANSGASIDELTTATGWQPHSVRAVISGLRKRGYDILPAKQDDGTRRYMIAGHPKVPIDKVRPAKAETT